MRSTHRRVSGVCLVLYLLVAGGLPAADAVLAASGGSRAAHIEDASQRHGGHDHLSCQICRVIDRNLSLDAGAQALAATSGGRAAPVAAASDVAVSAPVDGTNEARAPPRA